MYNLGLLLQDSSMILGRNHAGIWHVISWVEAWQIFGRFFHDTWQDSFKMCSCYYGLANPCQTLLDLGNLGKILPHISSRAQLTTKF